MVSKEERLRMLQILSAAKIKPELMKSVLTQCSKEMGKEVTEDDFDKSLDFLSRTIQEVSKE